MFEEIKEKCPKGYGEVNKYLSEFDALWEIKPLESIIGWLFRFFDSVGIRVAVIPHTNGTFRPYLFKKAGKVWTFLELEGDEYGFSIRLEAWKVAFTKAFEILEQR